MPDRANQVITYLSDAEYSQLKEWSNETGKSMSHLLREAILEYTDRDRTARIEEKVDQLLTLQGAESEQTAHTHTNPHHYKSVPEKARQILRRIRENHTMPVKGSDVEIAIEDIAGGDDRTVEKYKSQLKKRQFLFRHPMQPVWTDNKREWVEWVENATVSEEVHEYTEHYDISVAEFDELAAEVEQ